jgi:hypothetical protein
MALLFILKKRSILQQKWKVYGAGQAGKKQVKLASIYWSIFSAENNSRSSIIVLFDGPGGNRICDLYYKNVAFVNDHRKWCQKPEHHSRVINYALRVVNYTPRVINHTLRVINYTLRFVNYAPRVVNYSRKVINYSDRVINYAPRAGTPLLSRQL